MADILTGHGLPHEISVLIDMPDEICASILSTWLAFTDIIRLDSAVCNAEKRRRWLQIIRRPLIKYPDYSIISTR